MNTQWRSLCRFDSNYSAQTINSTAQRQRGIWFQFFNHFKSLPVKNKARASTGLHVIVLSMKLTSMVFHQKKYFQYLKKWAN